MLSVQSTILQNGRKEDYVQTIYLFIYYLFFIRSYYKVRRRAIQIVSVLKRRHREELTNRAQAASIELTVSDGVSV